MIGQPTPEAQTIPSTLQRRDFVAPLRVRMIVDAFA